MSELAIPSARPAQITRPTPDTDPTGGRLVAWAQALHAAHQIGTALCDTSFAPAAFRGKPAEAAAMILYGDELGLTPGAALQSGFVVSGRPGLYARAMAAIVLAKGHDVWTVEKSDAKVVVAGRRRGSTHTIEETWTTGRAQKAGYTTNKKYATDPQSMLYARALADVCRQIAPDALAGLDYTVEELDLMEPAAAVTVSRTTQPATKAQRKPAAITPPMAEPTLEPELVEATEPVAITLADVAACTTTEELRALWDETKDRDIRRAINERHAEISAAAQDEADAEGATDV